MPARERRARGPQGVVGHGKQNLVAIIEERRHADVDELRNAIARVDVLHLDVGQALELVVLHDGLASGPQALGIRVSLAIGELQGHVMHDLVDSSKTKGRRIADVQLEHVHARLLHAVCLIEHGTAHVIENVVELRGLFELAYGGRSLVGHLRCRRCSPGSVLSFLLVRFRIEPFGIDVERLREKVQRGLARCGLATHVLAQLALPQLEALDFGLSQQVDLFEPACLHRFFESARKHR